MRKLKHLLFVLVALVAMASCSDTETYADQKKSERSAINSYIANKSIKVISESQFHDQDSTTDITKNEYVLFENTGVYMQIIRKGSGEKLKDGETATVLCRFDEYNLIEDPDTMQLSNKFGAYAYIPEKMTVKNTSGTFRASFYSGSSLLYMLYSSSAVPNGWLVPLTYINLGRLTSENSIAKVKLIVPHTQGHEGSSSGVYPCLYEITYQRGR